MHKNHSFINQINLFDPIKNYHINLYLNSYNFIGYFQNFYYLQLQFI